MLFAKSEISNFQFARKIIEIIQDEKNAINIISHDISDA